jgi:hypothetical protein
MSQLKLTADSGGGTVAIKGPASTTGNAAIELTVPGSSNATLLTSSTNIGKVLQYKVAQKNDTASSAATTMVEISPDLRITITPTSASSLIVIQAQLSYMSYGNYGCAAMIKKNTASDFSGTTSNVYQPAIFTQSTHGNAINYAYTTGYMQSTPIQVYETAGDTAARTYSPFYTASSTSTVYLNQYGTGYRATSTMVVMEVAA